MGRFYIRHGEPSSVGIDLVNTTTGVGLFIADGETYATIRLTPDEAEKLADEMRRVAKLVREDNL